MIIENTKFDILISAKCKLQSEVLGLPCRLVKPVACLRGGDR
jgi:hypothetical protein